MPLSKTAAFSLQLSIILFFLAGSSAPTPLYSVYQAAWGFSPVTVTVMSPWWPCGPMSLWSQW